MKNVLITGGAGFIGSNYIRYMLDKYENYKIVNMDSLTYAGKIENLDDVKNNTNYCFEQGDIADCVFVNNVFVKYDFDFVINFAAESHVDNSIENPGIFVKTNIMGTQVLLDAAKKQWQIGIDEEGYPLYRSEVKFLQVSTDEVYGALGATGMFTENTPLAPNSPYSASKASADMLVRAYGETFNLPINITRCSNNYGPFQFAEKLIPLMIMKAQNNEKLPVYGDGMQVRDWLHVSDHCSAIDVVLHKGQNREVYNVGGNNEKANIYIVKLILEHLDKNEELISYVQDRLGHDKRYAIDNTKITKELGWKPAYTFEEGIKKTINWYKNQK